MFRSGEEHRQARSCQTLVTARSSDSPPLGSTFRKDTNESENHACCYDRSDKDARKTLPYSQYDLTFFLLADQYNPHPAPVSTLSRQSIKMQLNSAAVRRNSSVQNGHGMRIVLRFFRCFTRPLKNNMKLYLKQSSLARKLLYSAYCLERFFEPLFHKTCILLKKKAGPSATFFFPVCNTHT